MPKIHIVVKALIKNKDMFLVLKTKDSDQDNNLSGWETAGGHLKKNEEILTGLNREIKEETGLKANILYPFNVYFVNSTVNKNIIGVNYLAEYINGDVLLDFKEHIKYKWASIPEIRKLKDSLGLQKEIDAYENFIKIKQ